MRRRAHHQCWGRCHCLHCAVQQAQGERARAATWLKLWGYWFSKREQQSRTKGRRTPSLLSYTVCLHSLLPSPHLLPSFLPPSIFSFFFLALFVFPLWCSPEHKSWFKKKISFVLLKKGSLFMMIEWLCYFVPSAFKHTLWKKICWLKKNPQFIIKLFINTPVSFLSCQNTSQ